MTDQLTLSKPGEVADCAHYYYLPLADFQTLQRSYAEYIARLALTMGRMHDFY